MTLTLVGVILLPVGLLMLLRAPQRLYGLTVFFVPFSSTAVLVYQGRQSPHWLPVVNWFGILFLLSLLPRFLRTATVALPSPRGRSFLLLGVFVLTAAVTLIMPIIVDGRMRIASSRLIEAGLSTPLYLRLNHFLVLWDLAFGAAIATVVAKHSATTSGLERTLRVATWSALFVSAWGLAEYAAYQLGTPFPYWVFNNNPTESLLAGGRVLTGDVVFKRIASVAIEPSVLAQALVPIVPILAFATWSGRPIVSRLLDRVTLASTIATLLLCAATSAYAGLGIVVLGVPLGLFMLGRFHGRAILSTCALLGGIVATYALIPSVRELVDVLVISKPTSDSALERLMTTVNAWQYFRQYPVLGLGWGSVPSTDLLVYLLANSGVVGLIVFLSFLTSVFLGLRRGVLATRSDPNLAWLGSRVVGVALGLAAVLLVSAVARFTYEYAHFWLVLGAGLGATATALRARNLAEVRR